MIGAFSGAGPGHWNSLQSKVCSVKSVLTFRSQIKTHPAVRGGASPMTCSISILKVSYLAKVGLGVLLSSNLERALHKSSFLEKE